MPSTYNVTLRRLHAIVFCTGKAITTTYCGFVSVALVIQHAKRMCHMILSCGLSWGVPCFSTLSHKRHDFLKKRKKKLLNIKYVLIFSVTFVWGTRWRRGTALQAGRSWVRFPMVSLEFFIDITFHGRTMALGLTQSLKEMRTRNISCWGTGGRCVGLTTLPPSCADCLEFWQP